MNAGGHVSNSKKNGKMFMKDTIGSRRNSQDKPHNNSIIHNNNSVVGQTNAMNGYCA